MSELFPMPERVRALNPQTGEIRNAGVPPEYLKPEYRKGWSY